MLRKGAHDVIGQAQWDFVAIAKVESLETRQITDHSNKLRGRGPVWYWIEEQGKEPVRTRSETVEEILVKVLDLDREMCESLRYKVRGRCGIGDSRGAISGGVKNKNAQAA